MNNTYLSNYKISLELFRRVLLRNLESLKGYEVNHDKPLLYKYEFVRKFTINFLSAMHLRNGIPITGEEKDGYIYDTYSINTVIRTCFETYLLYFHLFLEQVSEDEANARFLLWWREGLSTRQKVPAKIAEHMEKLNDEARSILAIEADLEKNSFFKSFDAKQKKHRLKNSNWRPGWYEILEHSDFKCPLAKSGYGILSSYTHCESLGMLQMVQVPSYEVAEEINKSMINLLLMVASLVIVSTPKSFPNAKFLVNEEEKNCLETWKFAARLSEGGLKNAPSNI